MTLFRELTVDLDTTEPSFLNGTHCSSSAGPGPLVGFYKFLTDITGECGAGAKESK